MYQTTVLYRDAVGNLGEWDRGAPHDTLEECQYEAASLISEFRQQQRNGTWCQDPIVRVRCKELPEIPYPESPDVYEEGGYA